MLKICSTFYSRQASVTQQMYHPIKLYKRTFKQAADLYKIICQVVAHKIAELLKLPVIKISIFIFQFL